MRRTVLGAIALVAIGLTSACGPGHTDNTQASGSSTAPTTTGGSAIVGSAPAHAPTARSTSDPAGNQSVDGSSPNDMQTPSQAQPGNPCRLANDGAVFEADYGGKWTQLSADNPPQSGPYKKRICVLSGMVPGAYSGTPGVPVPVKVAVVTYIDDINGTLFNKLVAKAKADNAYTAALPNNDGNPAGDDGFFDGTPGFCPLTARDPLDHALVIQIAPIEDQYKVFFDDPEHAASLVSTMSHLMYQAAPK